MTEPVIQNYDKVENLHIGDNYSGKDAPQQPETKYKVKYIVNIEKQAHKPNSERASDTYSPEEKAEYEEYMAKLRANEPKTHKAKWW